MSVSKWRFDVKDLLFSVIPKVTKHLLSNPVYTCITLAACMEIGVVAGFAAFLGKYLEQQFNLTTSSANQLLGEGQWQAHAWHTHTYTQPQTPWCNTVHREQYSVKHQYSIWEGEKVNIWRYKLSSGMTAIPCACLGIFLGGLLVKKLNLSALGAIRMAMLVNLISTACYVSFLFLGCDTGPVAGVTVPYGNE